MVLRFGRSGAQSAQFDGDLGAQLQLLGDGATAWCSRVVSKIWEFNPQELSKIVWGFATVGVKGDDLLDAVRGAAIGKIWELNLQDLTNTVTPVPDILRPPKQLSYVVRSAGLARSGSA